MSQKKNFNNNGKDNDDDDGEKQRTEYEYCKVCKLNHNIGRRHNYFPNHKKALSSFLSRFQSKIKNDVAVYLKNPSPLLPQHQQQRNRLWCDFCDSDILESAGSFACGNAIEHLASAKHLKQVKGFLWKYGGGMDRIDSFRVSELDFAKWEKKCKLLKTEASGEGSLGSFIGPSNDIQTEMKSECVESFEKNDSLHSLNFEIKFPNGVVPLQNHTNERSQVLHTEISRVSVDGPQIHNTYMGTDVGVGAGPPKSLSGSFANQHLHFGSKEHPAYSRPINGCAYPYERIATGEISSQGTSTSDIGPHGLLRFTQLSASAEQDTGGNVHSGAPPPWFSATESIQLDNKANQDQSRRISSLSKLSKSSKLNPKRVGAAWAERRKIELELQKNGELVSSSFDADWLPNFGRVWQAGSRKESRKEFMGENKTLNKVDSQMDSTSQLQPYISKRIRRDTIE